MPPKTLIKMPAKCFQNVTAEITSGNAHRMSLKMPVIQNVSENASNSTCKMLAIGQTKMIAKIPP
jgi:hypothetical protein